MGDDEHGRVLLVEDDHELSDMLRRVDRNATGTNSAALAAAPAPSIVRRVTIGAPF